MASKNRIRVKKLLLALTSLLLTLFATLLPPSQANDQLSIPAGSQTIQLPANAKPNGMIVNIGMLIENIYDVNLANASFLAEGWYWLSWGEDVQAALKRNNIAPSEIVEFSNEIERGQYFFTESNQDKALLTPSDKYSYQAKFSGKFYIDNIEQRLAPFDEQKLGISLEVRPLALSTGFDEVTLIPPPIEQLPIAGEFSGVDGFRLTNTSWSRQIIRYVTPASDSISQAVTRQQFSRVTALFTYTPNTLTVFLKWLLPIAVVMGIVILAPSINGALGDARLAIPSAALLTLVLLQDAYKTSFPPAPYLTYLDELYTYSYLVCFAIFLLFLIGTNAHSRASEEDRELVAKRVNRLDLVVQCITLIGFLLVAIVGWHT
jgi:hypothetical protein